MSSQGYGSLSIFSKDEEIISEILSRAGLKFTYSRVLLSLYFHDRQTSRDIERMTNLRQPEVSIALKYLQESEWVSVDDQYLETSARPIKNYRLSHSFDAILDSIMTVNKDQCNSQIQVIEKIRTKALKK